jgi:hypothetical protein
MILKQATPYFAGNVPARRSPRAFGTRVTPGGRNLRDACRSAITPFDYWVPLVIRAGLALL